MTNEEPVRNWANLASGLANSSPVLILTGVNTPTTIGHLDLGIVHCPVVAECAAAEFRTQWLNTNSREFSTAQKTSSSPTCGFSASAVIASSFCVSSGVGARVKQRM